MRTTLDTLDILYQLLKSSTLMTAVSGELYHLSRPVGSKLEDVVINSLPLSHDQIQRGLANVNIYVADLSLPLNGQYQLVANSKRLKELGTLAAQVLGERVDGDYALWLTSTEVVAELETGQHYLNLRMEVKFFPSIS